MEIPHDVFSDPAISDETRAFNADFIERLTDLPSPLDVPVDVMRQARAAGRGVFPLGGPLDGSEWVEIQGAPGGPGRLRRSPGGGHGTYLHIHGGGWTLGAADQYDRPNQALAEATGAEVLSAAYRLAPEHPWPAAIEDCEAALDWVLANQPGPIVVGGESAGAHLSAMLLLRLKARGALGRVAGVVLNYGMFDLRLTPSAQLWGDRYLVLSTPVIRWFVGNLLGGQAPDTPHVSPLLEDLTGMPPALLQVGTWDPLLDDTLFMAARWQAAGSRADLAVYPGGIHAFDAFDIGIAREAAARQATFLSACL